MKSEVLFQTKHGGWSILSVEVDGNSPESFNSMIEALAKRMKESWTRGVKTEYDSKEAALQDFGSGISP